jgi:glycine/D-amino acid oxidase-like deaminating enzyme/nitrite reductase/ring-hydroxylating ferredoxin subunit
MANLPGKAESCWLSTSPVTIYPSLAGSKRIEVLIVGGGIVGLTAAIELRKAGCSVILLEARRIGRQVTGRSTAKITTQHGLIYHYLSERFGGGKAQAYADANRTGMQRILQWITEFGIPCDLETKSAYAYTSRPERRGELEKEAEIAREVGFSAEVLDQAPLPFATADALCFREQAQFNPASYLVGLAAAVGRLGGHIYEESPARLIESGERWRAVTDEGSVDCQHIVVATNLPVKSPVSFSGRTRPRSHVVMAFRTENERQIDGMFISLDEPLHSIRTGRDREGSILVVLGGRFLTGHDGDVARRFRNLDRWTRENFMVREALWRWCNEDYDTEDRVPYVGAPSPAQAPGFYIATGFNGWGVSNGTAAGILMADQILKRANLWALLYDPTRPSSNEFNLGGESQSKVDSLVNLEPGEGGVISRDGEEIAVWKNDKGQLHAVSAICTHQGCIVTWNNADRTWDCPCHGSIFASDGSVIHGPARKSLADRQL